MKKIIASTLAAALLTSSLGAFAQGGPTRDDRQGHRAQNQGQSHVQQRDQHGPNRQAQGNHDNRPSAQKRNADQAGGQRPQQQANNRPRGDGHYQRGDRLPTPYRGHQYVVDDWRGHGLKQPPRGHHWVQVGGEYILVAIATGVITSIILNGR